MITFRLNRRCVVRGQFSQQRRRRRSGVSLQGFEEVLHRPPGRLLLLCVQSHRLRRHLRQTPKKGTNISMQIVHFEFRRAAGRSWATADAQQQCSCGAAGRKCCCCSVSLCACSGALVKWSIMAYSAAPGAQFAQKRNARSKIKLGMK